MQRDADLKHWWNKSKNSPNAIEGFEMKAFVVFRNAD